jgi:predicted small metal-binding protein
VAIAVKNVEAPDEKRSFEHGDIRMVHLPGATIGYAVLQPGWRWSHDVQPIAGTQSCQATHTAVVVSGRLQVKMDDGEECELGPGDAHVVEPGHDAWVVGEEPCVTIDFDAVGTSALRNGGPASGVRIARCPCGVEFRIEREDDLDHLIAAVQEHARGSHGHEVIPEHVLEELTSA